MTRLRHILFRVVDATAPWAILCGWLLWVALAGLAAVWICTLLAGCVL